MADLPPGFRIVQTPQGSGTPNVPEGFKIVSQPVAETAPPIPQPVQPPLAAQATATPELMQEFLEFRRRGGLAGMMGMKPALEQTPREFAEGFAGPGAIRSVGAAARPVLGRLLRKPVPKAPTFEELKRLSAETYDIADQAGLTISNQSFGRSMQDLGKKLVDAGIDPTLHSKATRVFQRLGEEAAQDLPLRKFETLRRVAKGAASSIEPDERRIARIIVNHLDDYLGSIGQADVIAGDPVIASKALNRARSLWSRAKKGEEIETLIERANERASQFSGSGLENALRTEFRQLAMNPKRMRLFTPQEQAMIKRVGQGGPVGNALRMLGKFAPTGVVSTGLGGGIGFMAGGPVGSAAVLGAGAAARKGAEVATARAARQASEMMRRGGPSPASIPKGRIPPPSRGQGLIFGVGEPLEPLGQRRKGGR